MMPVHMIDYATAFLAGLLLGFFYFGGLWLTLRNIGSTKYPGVLMAASFFLRLSITLALFYYVMNQDWLRLLLCVAAFLVMRQVLLKTWGHGEKPFLHKPKRGTSR